MKIRILLLYKNRVKNNRNIGEIPILYKLLQNYGTIQYEFICF